MALIAVTQVKQFFDNQSQMPRLALAGVPSGLMDPTGSNQENSFQPVTHFNMMVAKESVLERSPTVAAPQPSTHGEAVPDFFKNFRPFAGTLQVVDLDEATAVRAAGFSEGRMPTLDELDDDLIQMVENMIRMKPIVIFSSDSCQPCIRLNAFLKHIGLGDQAVSLPVDSNKTGFFDRATEKTFSGREVVAYLSAKYDSKSVPNLFFKGVRVGGTLKTLALISKGVFWKALESEGIEGP